MLHSRDNGTASDDGQRSYGFYNKFLRRWGKQLTSLGIHDTTGRYLPRLPCGPQLLSLDLSGTYVSQLPMHLGLGVLDRCTALTCLQLSSCRVSTLGCTHALAPLQALINLKRLHLTNIQPERDNATLPGSIFVHLSQLTCLELCHVVVEQLHAAVSRYLTKLVVLSASCTNPVVFVPTRAACAMHHSTTPVQCS